MIAGWLWNRLTIRRHARSILKMAKAAWGAPHVYERINYLKFTQCDLGWYDDERRKLEELGFTYLHDFTDRTIQGAIRDAAAPCQQRRGGRKRPPER